MTFKSGKIYTHAQGLSCAFRQWRAESRCRFLHGYSLQVELEFEQVDGKLDKRNWVMGYGELRPVKEWLEANFDHKTLIARDDPGLRDFMLNHDKELLDLKIVTNVGTESFCKMIYDWVSAWLKENYPKVLLSKVLIREHEGNWASYQPDKVE